MLVKIPIGTAGRYKIFYIHLLQIPLSFYFCISACFVYFHNIGIAFGRLVYFFQGTAGAFVAIIAKVYKFHSLLKIVWRMCFYDINTGLHPCHRLK